MELSTNKLFKSSKKLKISLKKKSKLSTTKLTYVNKSNQRSKEKKENSNKNSNKKNCTISKKINPFNEDFIKYNYQTNNLPNRKITSSKEQNIYLKFLSHEINDARHNVEQDSNAANENILNTEFNIDEKNKNKNDVDIDTLVNLFKHKSSKLKSTIIMDNNGNNNLDSEQKKLIMDCFDKKTKMENNVKKCKIYNSINLKNNKTKNFIRSDRTKRFKTRQPSFTSTLNFKFKSLLKFEERKNNEDFNINKNREEKEDNSIFENCTNKSFDSSFLGSSLAEDDFIHNINNDMQTIS